jgi:O-antigen/teichoic acid export membrane protein
MTRELTDEQYGIVATLTALLAFFTPPLLWGIVGAVSVEYYKRTLASFRVYFSSVLILPLVAFFPMLAASVIGAKIFSSDLGVPVLWFAVIPVFGVLTIFPQLLSTLLRVKDRAFAFAGFEIFSAVFAVALSILFVLVLKWEWQGRMLAIALTSLIATAIAIIWLYRLGFLAPVCDRDSVVDAFKFGAGLVPHDLANNALRVIDRLVLVAIVGLAGAGQYAVAMQIASIMLVMLSAFNKAWAPFLFSRLREGTEKDRRLVVKISYGVILGAILFFIAFNAVTPVMYFFLIDAKFSDSMNFVVWITLGYVFMAVYLIFVDYIFYTKKTHILSMVTTFNLVCNALLNYIFIQNFGAVGAAYAFCITMVLVAMLTFVLSNKVYPMPWFFWIGRADVK